MRGTARARVLMGVVLAAAVAVLGLTGCGRLGNGGAGGPGEAGGQAETTELGWEAQALEAIGFSSQELVPVAAVAEGPTPSASAKDREAKREQRHKRLRFAFSHRVLHGEAVVQTDEGTKTVVVQRGTVTGIDATSVTVKSADGFTLTWKFGDPVHVVEHRTQVQPNAIAVGTEVGVAGAKDGDTAVARLIVVPNKKK